MARIDLEALALFVGAPIDAACTAQSIESRYGRSIRGNPITALVLGRLQRRARRDDAMPLPRFVTLAAGPDACHVTAHRRIGPGGQIKKAAVEQYEVLRIAWADLDSLITVGPFWTSITLVDTHRSRSAQLFIGRIMTGRTRTVNALRQRADHSSTTDTRR